MMRHEFSGVWRGNERVGQAAVFRPTGGSEPTWPSPHLIRQNWH
jgi:hypothetical protein